MSADFLTNLALRATEQDRHSVDGVRPRLASLFEASFALSEQQAKRPAMAEVEADGNVAGPGVERLVAATVRRQTPSTAPAQTASASENADFRLAVVFDAVRSPQRNSSILAPQAALPSYFGAIASPAADRTEGETGDFSIRPQVARVARAADASPGSPVLLPAQGQWDEVNMGEGWRPPTLTPRPSSVRLSAALPADERDQSAAALAPEPVIQVTIGRIEVRATQQQASTAAHKAVPSAQPVTLGEYQKQRSQRGGGR